VGESKIGKNEARGNQSSGFSFRLEVSHLEYKDEIIDLRTIEAILKYKPEIENNPFQSLDKDALMEAFKVIEEFSEEIKPI
jgi:hypothetical protein